MSKFCIIILILYLTSKSLSALVQLREDCIVYLNFAKLSSEFEHIDEFNNFHYDNLKRNVSFEMVTEIRKIVRRQRCQLIVLSHKPPNRRTIGQREIAVISEVETLPLLVACINRFTFSLITRWFYTISWGYDFLIYIKSLPSGFPEGFMKIRALKEAFHLGYELVIGLSWTVFTHPSTSVPISSFYSQWTSVSIILQADDVVYSDVILLRRKDYTMNLLEQWWKLGHKCCHHPPHEQIALHYLMNQYLSHFIGNSELHNEILSQHILHDDIASSNITPTVSTISESFRDIPVNIRLILDARAMLREGASEWGLINSNDTEPFEIPRISLRSCLGTMRGCVPKSTPAMFYVLNVRTLEQDSVKSMLFDSVKAWLAVLQEDFRVL